MHGTTDCVSTSSMNCRNPIYIYIALEYYCFFFSSYYVARARAMYTLASCRLPMTQTELWRTIALMVCVLCPWRVRMNDASLPDLSSM